MIISGNRGPIPLFLSGCFVWSGSSGIGTGSHLLRDVWQQYFPGLHRAAKKWYPRTIMFPFKTQLTGQGLDCASRCLGQHYRPNVPWVKNHGTRPGPMAQPAQGPTLYKGSGPGTVPQGQGQRPEGLRDLVPYINHHQYLKSN